jgi:hypothetical protein
VLNGERRTVGTGNDMRAIYSRGLIRRNRYGLHGHGCHRLRKTRWRDHQRHGDHGVIRINRGYVRCFGRLVMNGLVVVRRRTVAVFPRRPPLVGMDVQLRHPDVQ